MFEDLEDLIQNCGSSRIVKKGLKYFNDCSETNKFFVALAAPSLTGKTQLAFSITAKLPLYFVFDDSQIIYRSFHILSRDLVALASEDVSAFNRNSQPITLTLLKYKTDFKFKSLGLLFTLMDIASSKFCNVKPSIDEWMKHFSNLKVNPEANIRSVSISEFQCHPNMKKFTSEFYVFLDEFSGIPELVLIRNLCIILNMTCVLASTNACVVNLIGMVKRSGSRSEGPALWSAVVPHLPPIPNEIIAESSLELEEKLEKLVHLSKFTGNGQRMKGLSKYLVHQCFVTRPGVSKLLSDTLDSYLLNLSSKTFNIDDFFSEFMIEFSQKIAARKDAFCNDFDGMKSNVKLLLGNCFKNDYVLNGPLISHDQMLDKHFYYLKNPYCEDESPFLLYRKNNRLAPHICFNLKSRIYSPQCYFNLDEQLLLLGCMLKEMEYSTSKLFSDLSIKTALGDSSNINASSLSGDELENISCAAIIESSHYSVTSFDGTLKGVTLKNFFSNFISNLNLKCKNPPSLREPIAIDYGPDLETFMNSIKIPFLFPANTKVPTEYYEIFPLDQSLLRFGEYVRTANNQQVDACFDLFDQNNQKCISVLECKNRHVSLSPNILLSNLTKSIRFSQLYSDSKCILHLTMCRSFVSAKDSRTNWKSLAAFSNQTKINIYCLKISENGFTFTPFSQIHPKHFVLHPDPSFISIIIETDLILKYFDDK